MRSAFTEHTRGRHGRAGFSLVESLIAVSLLAILFLAVAQTSSRASDAFDEGSGEHELSTTVHRCIERIADAMHFADGTILDAQLESPLGASEVTFQTPVDFQAGAVVWNSVRIAFELEPGELDDDVDNDGDGLVDERLVVLADGVGTPEERRRVLASGVAEYYDGELPNNVDDNGNGLTDEPGLVFTSNGNVVTVRLTCQRRDDGGRLLTKTAVTAVRLRNNGG